MHENSNSLDFELLYKQHQKKLFKATLYLTKNNDNAQDLLQDSFVRAFTNFEKFDGSNFYGWMLTIINRLFINRINRKKENYIKIDCDAVQNHIPFNPHLDIENYSDDITNALNKLPDNYANILKMAYVDEYSYDDISKMTNIKLGTVKTRIHRSKKMLHDSLSYKYRPACKVKRK